MAGLSRSFSPDSFDMVILDESHIVLNPETHLFREVFKASAANPLRHDGNSRAEPATGDIPAARLAPARLGDAQQGFAPLIGREWVVIGERESR